MSKKRKNSYYDEYDYNENYYDDDNYDNNEYEQKKKLTGFESEYDRDEYDDYNDLDDENFNNYDDEYDDDDSDEEEDDDKYQDDINCSKNNLSKDDDATIAEEEEVIKELDGIEFDDDDFNDENDDNDDENDNTKKKKKSSKKTKKINDGIYDLSTPKSQKFDHSGSSVRQRFYSIMEDYHSNDPAKKTYANERAMKEMEGFIHLIIKRSYSTYTKKYYYDLVQEGYLGVITGMEKYNPDISMPSTFFFPYIKHEMQKFITQTVDKTTAHYSSNIKKINKAIEKLEEKGIAYTNVDIAIQTGMTIETVDQSLAIRNRRDEVHIEACPPYTIDSEMETSREKTPEEQYMDDEEKRVIYRAMSTSLTEEEYKILQYHFGLNDTDTIPEGEIAKRMGIPKDKVKRLLNKAIRKLRQSELSNIYGDHMKKNDKFLEEIDVPTVSRDATESDIEFLSQIDSIMDD